MFIGASRIAGASVARRLSAPPLMGLEEAEIGDTWFTTFDEKGDDLDLDGVLADDLVGDDLKRIFNVEGEAGDFAPDELDELQVRHLGCIPINTPLV